MFAGNGEQRARRYKDRDEIPKILLDQKNNGMDYKAEMLLFLTSRFENVRLRIIPALKEGEIVISNCFLDSTTVYKGMEEE